MIEEIIARNPIVTIDEIDQRGNRWFSTDRGHAEDGGVESHSFVVDEDESWRHA